MAPSKFGKDYTAAVKRIYALEAQLAKAEAKVSYLKREIAFEQRSKVSALKANRKK